MKGSAKFPALFVKTFVTITVLVGVFVNVYLVSSVARLSTPKAATAVDVFFTPEAAGIPPDTVFKFMIDPKSQNISFLRTTIYFDREVLQLSSNPVLGNSNLFTYQSLTPASEANLTGRVDLTLVQRPGSTPPSNLFEVFSLPVTFLNSAPATTSYITVGDEETQIVGSNAQEIPFAIRYATVRVRGGGPMAGLMDKLTSNQSGSCPANHIDTAIGCIPINDTQSLAAFWLRWGLGIAGGIALILIVYSGYMISTSQADPHKLQAGKELLTAATTGLVLLVFGAYLLRIIGVDILQIPGFN